MLPSLQLKERHKSTGNLFAFNYAYKMTKFNVFFRKQISLVWVSWEFSLAALPITEKGNLFAFNYGYKMTKFNVFFRKQISLVWVSWDFSLAALPVTEMNKK